MKIPADVVSKLIDLVGRSPNAPTWVPVDRRAVALRIGVGLRSVERWLAEGAPVQVGWAFVGVAYRMGGAELAKRTLETLAQAPLPGADVWGRRSR